MLLTSVNFSVHKDGTESAVRHRSFVNSNCHRRISLFRSVANFGVRGIFRRNQYFKEAFQFENKLFWVKETSPVGRKSELPPSLTFADLRKRERERDFELIFSTLNILLDWNIIFLLGGICV